MTLRVFFLITFLEKTKLPKQSREAEMCAEAADSRPVERTQRAGSSLLNCRGDGSAET